MAKYATKTCYDCGIQNPANLMERVTESYNSGRSDRRPDAANVVGFLISDTKTSQKMIKSALTKNNRRSYTRNRTVWKCLDCSGHNASAQRAAEKEARAVRELEIKKAEARGRMSVTSNGPKRPTWRPVHVFYAFILYTVASLLLNAI